MTDGVLRGTSFAFGGLGASGLGAIGAGGGAAAFRAGFGDVVLIDGYDILRHVSIDSKTYTFRASLSSHSLKFGVRASRFHSS